MSVDVYAFERRLCKACGILRAMVEPSADFDTPWEEALDRYFEPFMAFFFPKAHAEIDWSRGYEFLDTELQQVVRDAELGRRLADKLVKLWKRDGRDLWLLIHIEVQGQVEPDFAGRMYEYNRRIQDRYGHPVVSMALLTDDRAGWRPNRYVYNEVDFALTVRFPIVKLLDYRRR